MKYNLTDLTQAKYVSRNWHKMRRCDVSAGRVYGTIVISRENGGRGAGVAINKEIFMEAIANSNEEFLNELKVVVDSALKKAKDSNELSETEISTEESFASSSEFETVSESDQEKEPSLEIEEPVEKIDDAEIVEKLMEFKHAQLFEVCKINGIIFTERPTKDTLIKIIIKNDLYEGLI